MTVVEEYIKALQEQFESASNNVLAVQQEKYLLNQFEFLGLTSPVRRDLQKPFFEKNYLPPKEQAFEIAKILWLEGKREYQYFAQELCLKYLKQLEEEDIELFEWLIIHDSWWDTIDFIAPKLVGQYFLAFPYKREEIIQKWIDSNHLWLQRSSILFQLKYKEALDVRFLESVIERLIPSKEFFINKAIGWILREYAKSNPNWVLEYVDKTPLSNLSKREALKHLR